MKLSWAILAQGYAVDRTSNALSIFNVIEEISVPQSIADDPAPKSLGPAFSLITFWVAKSDAPKKAAPNIRVKVRGPDKKLLTTVEIKTGGERAASFRAVATLGAFPFRGVGTYSFSIEKHETDNWKRAGLIFLDVKAQGPAAESQGQAS